MKNDILKLNKINIYIKVDLLNMTGVKLSLIINSKQINIVYALIDLN